MIEDLKQIRDALEALLNYQQADMDGVMVLTSRQAIHEVSDYVRATLDRIIAEQKLVPQGWNTIDSAPKDGTEILLALWSGHPEHKTSFCWAINGHYKDGFFYSKDPMIGKLASPTHWQYITAPTPAQPEKLDVEALKREAWKSAGSPSFAQRIVSDAIDHLAEHYDFVRKV